VRNRPIAILTLVGAMLVGNGCGLEPFASRPYKGEMSVVELSDHTKIRYGLFEPESISERSEYPVVIAMPLGFETYKNAALTIRQIWQSEAEKNGWVVVSPAEPDERFFWRDKWLYGEGGEEYFPEFLSHLLGKYNVRGARFHLVAFGHNGDGAISIALQSPGYFETLILVPDFDPPETQLRKLAETGQLCITMLVSEESAHWSVACGREPPDIPGVLVRRIPIRDPGTREDIGPFVEVLPFVAEEISLGSGTVEDKPGK